MAPKTCSPGTPYPICRCSIDSTMNGPNLIWKNTFLVHWAQLSRLAARGTGARSSWAGRSGAAPVPGRQAPKRHLGGYGVRAELSAGFLIASISKPEQRSCFNSLREQMSGRKVQKDSSGERKGLSHRAHGARGFGDARRWECIFLPKSEHARFPSCLPRFPPSLHPRL